MSQATFKISVFKVVSEESKFRHLVRKILLHTLQIQPITARHGQIKLEDEVRAEEKFFYEK